MENEAAQGTSEEEQLRRFARYLLNDINALEKMLNEGKIESGVRRIGAEQEMVLVDKSWRPASRAMEVLERLDDPHFTPELAKFNLEINLDPLDFGDDCFSRMEFQLNYFFSKASAAAYAFDTEVVLIGILPTIRTSDLSMQNMTPKQRYFDLNEATNRMRGQDYELNIKGTDELIMKHSNVMLEAANTSFQVHMQVSPEEFARLHNVAQVAASPVLAAAVNSPFLGRYRLWRETRIALFQQSIDIRTAPHQRNLSPRVHFGEGWLNDSVLEIFQENVARHKVLLALDEYEDPFQAMKAGRTPRLKALCQHNGTVYHWNRACYGILDGKPHLRIENRMLPSGPTTTDEVANAAFWLGLVTGMALEYEDVTKVVTFDEAKDNFFTAAQHGLVSQIRWRGKNHAVAKVILKEFIPMAREGLRESKVDSGDIDRYLGIIEDRVKREKTGAQWMLASFSKMHESAPIWEKLTALTAATVARQKGGKPVHAWAPARLREGGGWKLNYLRVEQYMTTDLFTVLPEEPVDLVAHLMVWKRIRHVLVEDKQHQLVGIVSHRRLLRLFGQTIPEEGGQVAPVSSIMVKDPVVIGPDTLSLDAIRLMREKKISILPVLSNGKLIGVVTEDSFLGIAANLLEQKLKE